MIKPGYIRTAVCTLACGAISLWAFSMQGYITFVFGMMMFIGLTHELSNIEDERLGVES